jgi:hypothetical protein
MNRRSERAFEYDVCLSFAREQREFVRNVAEDLTVKGVRVFFDEYAEAELWGKDLYAHLDDVYQNAARFCVLFISKQYAKRVWTNHERQSAQARAIRENKEYILPVRFDNTPVPGLRSTVGYIDLHSRTASDITKLIIEKLGPRQRESYFPPVPDRLFSMLRLRGQKAKARAEYRARDFFTALGRMSIEEREVVFSIIQNGCPSALPENIHISLDLLRRITEKPIGRLRRLLHGLSSLGFNVSFREKTHDNEIKREMVFLEWHDMTTDDFFFGNSTKEADAVVKTVFSECCEDCAREALRRLDFSGLSSVTAEEDMHER